MYYFNKLLGISGSSMYHTAQALVPAEADKEPNQFNNAVNIYIPPTTFIA